MENGNRQLLMKLASGFVIVVLTLVVTLGITVKWSAQSIIMHSYMEKATLTAEKLVENIDVHKYEELAKNPVEGELYFELQEHLTEMLEINPITYMYVAIPPKAGEDEATTLVDAGALNSGDVFHIGETLDQVYYKDIMAVIEEKGSYSEYDNIEETGDIISSYVPLKGSDGEIFAILGVDDTLVTIGNIQAEALKEVFPMFLTVIIIISMVIMAATGWYLYRLLNPIGYLREATFTLGDGNIVAARETMEQVNLKQNTSITIFARAFRSTLARLHAMLSNIGNGSKDVKKTADAIYEVSETIDASTNSLVASIDDINTSVQQQETISLQMTEAMTKMSEGMRDITEQVHLAATSLQSTSQLIHNSSTNAATVSQQVQQMSETVKGTANNVQDLANRYSEIESMVAIIQGIADQTNLLALNASIEAARAGEHGKGFAVVAEEVRKLAELTKGSADDIRVQITDFKVVTQSVLNDMNESTTEVNTGAMQVKAISEELVQVLEQTNKVMNDVRGVETITTSIGGTVHEVSDAINEANDASSRVMQGTNIVRTAAETQEQTVVQLKQSIEQLTQTVTSFEEMLEKYKM